MKRILNEYRIVMTEHRRFISSQRSNVRDAHCDGERSYGASSGYVQYPAEIGIVGDECWRNSTPGKCELSLC